MKKEGLAKEAIPTKETPKGMSKRFYAACMALNGLLSNPDVDRFGAIVTGKQIGRAHV